VSKTNHHEPKLCCVCGVSRRFVYGRCPSCLKGISPQLLNRLRAMPRTEREAVYRETANHPRPRWVYEGHEDELIAEQEALENKDRTP